MQTDSPRRPMVRIRELWERLIRVEHPDEQLQRIGQVFNILLFMTLDIVIAMFIVFLSVGLTGLMPYPDYLLGAIFPLGFIPFSAYCFYRVKQGKIESTVQIFVWGNYLGIALACLLFDDVLSAGWVLFFWPIVVAGIVAQPNYSLWLSGGVLVYYALMLLVTSFTPFRSPFTSADARLVNFVAFTLIMLLSAGGGVIYLSMRSLRQALSSLQNTTAELETARSNLEQRVVLRTQQLRDRADQFQAIAELNRALAGVFDFEELLERAVGFISERFQFYHVGIFLLDDTGGWMLLRAASSEPGQQMLAERHSLEVGSDSLVGKASATLRPQIVGRVEQNRGWYANPHLPETASEMVLPLVARGDLLGILDIQSKAEDVFSEEDVQVLSILAEGLSVFIENTRLLSETRGTLERLQRYQEEEVVKGWRQALTRRKREIAYAYDRVRLQDNVPEDFDLSEETVGLDKIEMVQKNGTYQLRAPVRIQRRTLGVFVFESQRAWSEQARRLAADVIEQLELALENARLLEETRLRAAQERARSEIVGRVRTSVRVDAILRSAAEELGRALQVDRARLQLVSKEMFEPSAADDGGENL